MKKDARVLIKPNLVTYHKNIEIPPFGVYTTTWIIESLIKILQNQIGVSKISIGEGSVKIMSPSPTAPGSSVTKEAFEGLGYTRLAKQYNVALIDFDDSAEVLMKTPDGIPLKIAKDALECDFFINVPVLKTHSQTMVSLGIKNLKGCLKTPSKNDYAKSHPVRHGYLVICMDSGNSALDSKGIKKLVSLN